MFEEPEIFIFISLSPRFDKIWYWLLTYLALVPIYASMNWSALIQVMACCLFVAKPSPEPIYWLINNWTLGKKPKWNSNQNTKIFIHENTFENVVCEMAVILSRGDELIVSWTKSFRRPLNFFFRCCFIPQCWNVTGSWNASSLVRKFYL